MSVVDKRWELIDPNPNIHELFIQFNDQFFYSKLGSVYVEWSKRMTRSIEKSMIFERRAYLSIQMCWNLLLSTRWWMSNCSQCQLFNIETSKRSCWNFAGKTFFFWISVMKVFVWFQHEMIHAFLFVTHNNRVSRKGTELSFSDKKSIWSMFLQRIVMVMDLSFWNIWFESTMRPVQILR